MSLGAFKPAAGSGSTDTKIFGTVDPTVTTLQEIHVQLEGFGATAAWKWYEVTQPAGTVVSTQIMQMNMVGPLFNVSANGAAGTGAITTGNILTSGILNSVTTQRLLTVGGYLAMEDTGTLDATANTLDSANAAPGNWWLLRYNKTLGYAEQSTATDASAHRIWSPLSGGTGLTSLNGLTGSVTLAFTNGSVSATGSTLTLQIPQSVATTATPLFAALTVSGTAGVASVVSTLGYMQSGDGFYTASPSGQAFHALNGGGTFQTLTIQSSSATAISVASGAVSALFLSATDRILIVGQSTAPPGPPGLSGGTPGQASFYADMSGNPYYWNHATSGWLAFGTGGSSGSGVTSLAGTTGQVIASAATGAVTLSLPQSIATTSTVAFAGVSTTGAFNSGATGASTAIQVNSGAFQVLGNGTVSGQGASFNGISSSTTITAASTIQSTAAAGGVAFQAGGGAFVVSGNGNVQGQTGTFNNVNSTGLANFSFYDVGGVPSISAGNIFVGAGVNVGTGNLFGGNFTASGAFNSTATGVSKGIQVNNGAFVVFGNGNVTGGNFTSSGVFNSTATGASTAIQVNNGAFVVLGNGTVTGQAASFNGVSSSTTMTAASTIQSTAAAGGVAFQAGGGAFVVSGNGNVQGQTATFNAVNSTGLGNFSSYDVSGVPSISTGNIFVGSGVNIGSGIILAGSITLSTGVGTVGLNVVSGYIQSAGGFYAPSGLGNAFNTPGGGTFGTLTILSAATNAIQCTGGGGLTADSVYAKYLYATTQIALQGIPHQPGAPPGGEAYFYADASGNPFWYSHTTAQWIPFGASSASGVTSINYAAGALSLVGGIGVQVNLTGQTLTLSCPQINANGAFVGAGVSVGTNGVACGNLYINGGELCDISRNVSVLSLSTTGGTPLINSAGQFVGNGVNTSSGINCAGYSVNNGVSINASNQFVGAGVNVGTAGVNCGGIAINGAQLCDGSRNIAVASFYNSGQFRQAYVAPGSTIYPASSITKWVELYNVSGSFVGIIPVY